MKKRFYTQALVAVAVTLYVIVAGAAEDLRVQYARQLLQEAGKSGIEVKVDDSAGGPEAFSISGKTISGGGPAGALYGVQEYLRPALRKSDAHAPDFELRGSVLFLMKEGSYDFKLTPTEFPWFYDREVLTDYFDYLFENRFNAVFLWTGNLFANIVEMPEYPDASDLTKQELLRNQAQFKWFTRECAKRNITVLLHFYNIHLPKPLAESRGIPMHYRAPDEFAAKYMRYALGRFISEFDSVGLYVCPGEVLNARYTPEWIRDVIFKAALDSGKHPLIVIRDWGLDAEGFRERAASHYDNAYTELKHNIEMIVSPVPDPRHKEWIGVAKKHIVNVHEVSDVKPFRWGSPAFIHEMVGNWKEIGLDGAEVYGMISWRWPYTMDKLEAHQTTYWPTGEKLLTFDRDWIWLEAIGRYLWHVDRDPAAERKYWIARLEQRFGDADAAELLLDWYQTTGPILPGLQNLTSVANMNWHPTVIGNEQYVDRILSARDWDDHQGTGNYLSQPVDDVFFQRYKKEYGQPNLTDRKSMCVAEYAHLKGQGKEVTDRMRPDRVADLLVKLAEESVETAKQAASKATEHRAEAERFVSDSQALVLVTQAWREKVHAALEKGLWQETGNAGDREAMLKHLRMSIPIYEKLVALTDKTYVNPTDMVMRLNWPQGLENFKRDLEGQQALVDMQQAVAEAKARPDVTWLETEEMAGEGWKTGTNYEGYFGTGFAASDTGPRHGAKLTKTVAWKLPQTCTVWAHGLLTPDTDRGFSVTVAGKAFDPAFTEKDARRPHFAWKQLGTLELPAGYCDIVIADTGDGYECPDVIVLTTDAGWTPPGMRPVSPTEKTQIWNGRDFSGWKMCLPGSDVDPKTVWSVVEGAIHCTGKPNGYLRTTTKYTDYRLHVEWRWAGKPGNSGVLLHINGEDKVWPRCIEGQLMNQNAGDFYSIDGVKIAELKEGRHIPRKQPSSEKPVGEWNRYDITCRDNTITLVVNDVEQNRATGTGVDSGWIALQSEGAPIEFRNVYLEPLE